MEELKPFIFTAEEIANLRREFSNLKEVTLYSEAPELAAKVASLGIQREVGTVNDELARFIFDRETGLVVDRNSLHAEFVSWRDYVGLRITSTTCQRLEIRARWLIELLHPKFSPSVDGAFSQLVFFPEIMARIAALQGVELVLVKTWGLNSIFGGFDPAKGYYQTNFWELENNDALKFADLIRNGQLALMGTHDLIAHVAGVRREAWGLLKQQADQVHRAISTYFVDADRPAIASLILPYTLGVVLDDLAQPPTYGSASHAAVLESLIRELASGSVPPHLPTILKEFPKQFENIIQISRQSAPLVPKVEIDLAVSTLAEEIQRHSLLAKVNGHGGFAGLA